MTEDFLSLFEKGRALAEETGFNPYRVPYDSKAYIDLASNNYLGLAEHPAVIAAATAAAKEYGVSCCGTPVASGYSKLGRDTAKRLAAFAGLEEAVLFPSCYQANNGVFAALCRMSGGSGGFPGGPEAGDGPNPRGGRCLDGGPDSGSGKYARGEIASGSTGTARKECLILIDKGAHSSLIEGALAAGCRVSPFLHNDMEHLEKILRRSRRSNGGSSSNGSRHIGSSGSSGSSSSSGSRNGSNGSADAGAGAGPGPGPGFGTVYVVTESVFSTEGSLCPLPDIVELCRRYDAVPVVDDSHGIGVLGAGGRGVLEHFGFIGGGGNGGGGSNGGSGSGNARGNRGSGGSGGGNGSNGNGNTGGAGGSVQGRSFPGIYTASLGKALANMGGMAAGPAAVMEPLSYLCSRLIYSTALTPPVLGGINGALDVIGAGFPALRARMLEYHRIIRQAISAMPARGSGRGGIDGSAGGVIGDSISGFPGDSAGGGISGSTGGFPGGAGFSGPETAAAANASPINAIFCGDARRTIALSAELYKRGILSTPFIEPSVPKNAGVLRLIAGAGLAPDKVNYAAEQLCDIIW